MQSIITTIDELIEHKPIIDYIYGTYGEMPQHNYCCFYYKIQSNKIGDVLIYLDDSIPIIISFEKRKKDGIFQSTTDLYPILGKYDSLSTLKNILLKLGKQFGIDCFYFPLISADIQLSKDIINDTSFFVWNRLDCPVFRIGELNCRTNIFPESFYHPHSREKKLLRSAYVKELTAEEAQIIINQVESMSWKGKCKQDMISRNQIDYYLCLIQHNIINTIALLNKKDDTPIAYRMDSVVNKTVFVLKWSYVQEFSKLSPGYYLVARELFERYNGLHIKEFNLYGSPDSLKSKIENDRIKRIDCCFVRNNKSIALSLMRERIAHDQKVYDAYVNGKSIKTIYMK